MYTLYYRLSINITSSGYAGVVRTHCISQGSTFKLYALLKLMLTTQEMGKKMREPLLLNNSFHSPKCQRLSLLSTKDKMKCICLSEHLLCCSQNVERHNFKLFYKCKCSLINQFWNSYFEAFFVLLKCHTDF